MAPDDPTTGAPKNDPAVLTRSCLWEWDGYEWLQQTKCDSGECDSPPVPEGWLGGHQGETTFTPCHN